ncbi:hypothetical protein QOZ80_2AG0103480 [Eleusine coracana subsp. coracana]|nr:hypothetical protein QOZ80_2AG0103480 [Eleusine coracana subsp. coracana]
MASSAAGEPSRPPPPPGGWLSGLVSGAGRILAGVAAALGPESSDDDDTSSSPESSQSPPPPCRALITAGQGNGAHFASDNYQFNKSGNEIVLKDYGEGTRELDSDKDRKDTLAQLLMQETFSRSEYVALTKILQERVVDSDPSVYEPDDVLPLAWQPSTQQRPVALIPSNSLPQTSGVAVYSPLFDNTDGNSGLKKGSTTLEDPCTLKNMSHDQRGHAVKRTYSNKADTFEEPRRVRPKLNRFNTSEKVSDALRSHIAFDDPVSNDAGELRGFPEELKTISLLGTDNLTLSNIVSKGETSRPVRFVNSTSRRARVNKHDDALEFYPYPYLDLTESPVKVEPFDEFACLKPERMHLAQKNDEGTMFNESRSVSRRILKDIETAPSSSNGLQPESSSRDRKGFSLPGSIPTKPRSPANSSHRPSNRRRIGSWNRPPQQSNPAPVGQESKPCHVQEKRPVGRPRKEMR